MTSITPSGPDQRHSRFGEHLRHWLVVVALTLAGLLVAEFPVLSDTRDWVYQWLQQRLVRSHKSVIVIAIDHDEYWRGPLNGRKPLDRAYLGTLLAKVADANPTVIGLDIGLEMNDPSVRPVRERLTATEKDFLTSVSAASQRCSLVLTRTIAEHDNGSYVRQYDLFDALEPGNARITYGHTSSAHNPRQIPTRVLLEDRAALDSFAIALLRKVMKQMPPKLEDPNGPWPYSFFLPYATFAPPNAPVGSDGLLTARTVLRATPEQVTQWLEHQVVLIGGTWRLNSHGGAFFDNHATPIGDLPGVVVHANYVQSLLWDAMYALPRAARLSIEVLLALAMSMVFLLARGWYRLVLVVGTLVAVVVFTWVFSAAIGLFFDMVVPLAFLGVHALWEGASEELRLVFRRTFRYADHVFTIAALVLVISIGTIFVRHELHARDKQLVTENRLQVARLARPSLFQAQRMTAANARGVSAKPGVADSKAGTRRLVGQSLAAQRTSSIESTQRLADTRLRATISRWPRVMLLDTKARKIWWGSSSIDVAIHHDAQVVTPTNQIALAEPSGACGAELADRIATEFASSGTRVVDRASLKKLVTDHGLHDSSLFNDTAEDIQRVIGGGSLLYVSVDRCTNDLRFSDGSLGLRNSRWAPGLHGTMEASLDVLDLVTGEMADSKNFHAEAFLEKSAFDRYFDRMAKFARKVDEKAILRERLVADATEQVRRWLFGWTEIKTVPFFVDDECKLQAAFQQLEQGNIEGAKREAQASVTLCQGMRPLKPATLARAYYNRGITRLLLGENADAVTDLRQANKLAPSKTFADALTMSRD